MRRIWNCTVVLWHTLCASILRIDVQDAPATIERLVAHLTRSKRTVRLRALDRLLSILRGKPG